MIRKYFYNLGIAFFLVHSVGAQVQPYRIQNTPNSGVYIETNQEIKNSKVDTLRISSTNRSIARYIVASQHERVPYTVKSHEPTYRYEYKPKRYINDFAFSLYYSQESFIEDLNWDTVRFRNSDSKFVSGSQMNKVSGFGFNFLFGARNYIPQTSLGSFNWGLGMDFNHFSNGPKNQVVFSNDVEDKGFTRLETNAVNFHGIARYEKRVGMIYPYAAFKAGFNLYSTRQYTEGYRNSTDYESTNSRNISTHVTPFFSYELGMRVRLSSDVSLFASYENRSGNKLEVVNLANSTFNGFEYQNDVKTINYNIENLKIGVILNFSTAERERIMVSDGRSDTFYTTNLVVFDTVWLEEPQVRTEIIKVSDPRLNGYYLSKCKNCLCDTNAKTNNNTYINTKVIGSGNTEVYRNTNTNTNSELKSAPAKSTIPSNSGAEINTQSNGGGAIQNYPRSTNTTPAPSKSGSGTKKAFPGIKPPPAIKKPKS